MLRLDGLSQKFLDNQTGDLIQSSAVILVFGSSKQCSETPMIILEVLSVFMVFAVFWC